MKQETQSWCYVTNWRGREGREIRRGAVQDGGDACVFMPNSYGGMAKAITIL